MPDEDKRKHLDLLQGAISRMASNSFLLKGWSVTLATALFGLSTKEAKPELALLALLPIMSFWGLDAYYLALERTFRQLYKTATVNLAVTDYDMATEALNWKAWREAALRPAVLALHLPLMVVALLVYGLLRRC